MPAPRTYNTPGRLGINLQEKDQVLSPLWATVTEELVLNESNRLQCRGGFNNESTTASALLAKRAHLYVKEDGTEELILTTVSTIIKEGSDLTAAGNDITSTTAPTNGNWQFVNFNNKVLGWQRGHAPIVRTTGDFADIVAGAGTLPDGPCAVAAYGRVWAVDDDKQTIRYCALLDETDWSTASGGGSIDMRNVWTRGMDQVIALAAFSGTLVVFGMNHVVIYADGQGSALGLDPAQMYVVDTIEGTGCIARDTVQNIGEGDLLFLSRNGLQSLRRLLVSKDNPLETISWQIADHLGSRIADHFALATTARHGDPSFTGHYIPETGQYWLIDTYPEAASNVMEVYCFHMNARAADENGREVIPITFWDDGGIGNLAWIGQRSTGEIWAVGRVPTSGGSHTMQYSLDSNTDQGSTAINVDFESGWIDDEDPLLKILKFGQVTLLNVDQVESATSFKFATDYEATMDTITGPTTSDGRIVNLYDPTGDVEGQYFKVGITDTAFGGKVLQQIKLYLETGRIQFIHQKFDDYTAPQAAEDTAAADIEITLGVDGGIIDTILEIPNVEDETDGDTLDEIAFPVVPDADGVLVIVTTGNGQSTRTLSANYGNSNGGTYTALNGLDGSTGATSYMCYAEYIPITSAPTDGTLRLQWGSAPSAGVKLRIKVIPFTARATTVPSNTDTVQGQNLNADNTMTLALTTSHANSMAGVVVLVAPESGVAPYTVTMPSTEFDDEDLIWDSATTGRPQVRVYLARDTANSTNLGGDITVTGPAANTAGSFYAFEVPNS